MNTQSIPLGRKIIFFCITCSFLLLGFTSIQGQLDLWELDTLSFRQNLIKGHRTNTPIRLIGIDSQTMASADMNTLFGKYPWRRDAYALVVHFFKRSTPHKVLFDISFDGGRDTEHRRSDLSFVESLKNTSDFASSLQFIFDNSQALEKPDLPIGTQTMLEANAFQVHGIENIPAVNICRAQGIVPPLSDLYSNMDFYSPACIVKDQSRVTRYWTPLTQLDNLSIPNSALGMLLDNTRQVSVDSNGIMSWDKYQIHLGKGMPLIRWYGNQKGERSERPYTEYSFWDVIQSELVLTCRENPENAYCTKVSLPETPPITPELFNDSYIIAGTTSPNNFDSHSTIYGGFLYPGVYIIANTLDNVLHDDFVLPAPNWLNIIFGLFTCSAVLFMVFRIEQISTALMGTLVLSVGYFLLTILAYLQWNMWLNAVYPLAGMLACFSGGYVYRYLKSRKAREQLRFAFGKYVSPSVMQMIEKNPDALKLGGTREEMTMLFCDIRGFTTYSENNSPEEVQRFLTEYFSVMNNIILNKYQGTINKLIGDAIFAYWGFPLKTDEHALLAVSAALSMQDALKQWQNDPDKPNIDIGIGIHTGEAMVGNVGSEDFMDFTLIGDAVNTAARLESLNKEMKTRIIISQTTYEQVQGILKARPLGQTKIRGKETELGIYEPTGLKL